MEEEDKNSVRDELLKLALTVKIEPIQSIEKTVSVSDIIHVFKNLQLSYNRFLKIWLYKDKSLPDILKKDDAAIDNIIEHLKLMIVDLKFGSFESSIAPVIANFEDQIFSSEMDVFQKSAFKEYKENIVLYDYSKPASIERITEMFDENERRAILKPLFDIVNKNANYDVFVKSGANKMQFKIMPPPQKLLHKYFDKTRTEPITSYRIMQVFLKTKKDSDESNLSKKDIKEILYMEEMLHDTYPFKPDIIKFNDMIFVLSKKLDCEVTYEDDQYFISNELLDITVWAGSRNEAEEAFSFAFYAIYKNYYLEDNSKLTEDAVEFKQLLNEIIKDIRQ